jgi:hypothetical protein
MTWKRLVPWETTRKRGLPYFVLVWGLLYWATTVYLSAALLLFFTPLWSEAKRSFVHNWPFFLLLWFWTGTLWAIATWFLGEWHYHRRASDK